MVRYFSPFYRFSCLLLILLILPTFAVAQQCPLPSPGETKKEIPPEDQKEIPRGTCFYVTIKGKMRYETVSLSLDQTTGGGFHFSQDDGPTTIQTTDNQVLICSDGTSCGSVTISLVGESVPIKIGSVRSNVGVFVLVSNECKIPGDHQPDEPYCFYGEKACRVQGKYKQTVTHGFNNHTNVCFFAIPPCGEYPYACLPFSQGGPPDECITFTTTEYYDPLYNNAQWPCYWTDYTPDPYCSRLGAIGRGSMKCPRTNSIRLFEFQCY